MTAKIMQVLPDRRAVFGFAVTSQIDEVSWLASIGKSCSGRTCEVTAGRLIEFAALDTRKQAAIGFDLGKEGYWVGVEITDARVWKRIQAGGIDSFGLNLSPGGLVVDFAVQRESRGLRNMIDGNVLKIDKSCPCHALVSKALQAAEGGNPESVSKATFENALDALAKSYSAESGMDYHQAYCEVLGTEIGKKLYSGLVGFTPPAHVRKAAEGPVWGEIRKQAKELQAEDDTLTEDAAIAQVLEQDPTLYQRYLQSR